MDTIEKDKSLTPIGASQGAYDVLRDDAIQLAHLTGTVFSETRFDNKKFEKMVIS